MAALIGCVAPTDQSEQLRVVIEPIANLFAYDTVQALAHVVDQNGAEIRGVAITFGTSDRTLADVTPSGQVFSTGPGSVTITARAPGLRHAAPGQTVAVVHGAIEIDSVLPRRVRYGARLQIYGIGLDPVGAAVVNTGGLAAPIASYAPVDPAHPERYGALGVVVVPPLGQNSDEVNPIEVPVTVKTTHGAATFTTNLIIEPRDIYEPNDSVASDLGVISGRFDALGLAFDKLDLAQPSLPVDWYTFTTTTRGDWTITVKGADAWQVSPSADFVEGSLAYAEASPWGDPLPAWYIDSPPLPTVGTNGSCDGFFGALPPYPDPQNLVSDAFGLELTTSNDGAWPARYSQMRWALEDLPAGTHTLLLGYMTSFFRSGGLHGLSIGSGTSVTDASFRSAFVSSFAGSSPPIRYDLTIEPGIHTDLPPDRFEGNDFCGDAPTLLSLNTTSFTDSIVDGLTIDSELDYDWFVVEAQTPGRLYLTVEPGDQDQHFSPLLLTPTPGVRQAVQRMTLESSDDPLTHYESQMLKSQRDYAPGVFLQTGVYYLLIRPGDPRTYRMRFGWAPGTSVASVTIVPDSATIQVGSILTPIVTLRDTGGQVIQGPPIGWTTSNRSVAGVGEYGPGAGFMPGTTTITATSEGVSDSMTLTVADGCAANPTVNCLLTAESPALEPYFRSLGTYNPTSITFTNSSPQTVNLYWLDENGQRQLFNTLVPGQSYVQPMFLDNPWLITDTTDRGLAIYHPVSVDAQAVIN